MLSIKYRCESDIDIRYYTSYIEKPLLPEVVVHRTSFLMKSKSKTPLTFKNCSLFRLSNVSSPDLQAFPAAFPLTTPEIRPLPEHRTPFICPTCCHLGRIYVRSPVKPKFIGGDWFFCENVRAREIPDDGHRSAEGCRVASHWLERAIARASALAAEWGSVRLESRPLPHDGPSVLTSLSIR